MQNVLKCNYPNPKIHKRKKATKMKKLISILTLSITLLTSSILTTSANPSILPGSDTSYTMIALATQSTYNPSKSYYHTTIQNENGDAFIILTTDNVTGKWFECSVDSNDTPNIIQDDKIIDLGLLENTENNL